MSRSLADLRVTLTELATDLPGLIHPVMQRVQERVRDEVEANLSGRVLQQQSGDLLASVRVELEQGPRGATISATAGDSVVRYAAIHEHGGTIRPLTSTGWLRFQGRYGWATVREVTIPARPYLRPAMEAGAEELPDLLHDRLLALMRGAS